MALLFIAAIIVMGFLLGWGMKNMDELYRNVKDRKYQILFEIIYIILFVFVGLVLGLLNTSGGK